jgi:ribosomal protein S18 acetylase RimI-like enzyme
VDPSVLDNAVWHSLAHAHRELAERVGLAARYDPDVSLFGGIGDDAGHDTGDDPDDTGHDTGAAWRDLQELVGPSGVAVLFRAEIPLLPKAWTRLDGGRGHQMVLRELAPVDTPDARDLGPEDVGEMLALVELSRPGPFAVRTVELGGYVGVFDGDRLVAMAGQRLAPPGFREISAVCTHPDFRGRGLAAGLTALVARRILDRGERPFLHHAADNDAARRVYEAIGFEFRRQVVFAALGVNP